MKQTMSAFQLKHIDILHFIVATQSTKRGHGAVGSAFEWHSKGQGFESPWLHQKISCILYDIFLLKSLATIKNRSRKVSDFLFCEV